MAGLAILKHTFNLSDEDLCDRWLENPYYQYFCGEVFFCHTLPFERSSISRWRKRMGEERLVALLQESLSVAVKTGALKPADLSRVVVDTTVQPKNVTFPTDAKLVNRAREKLVKMAKRAGVALRQSYVRVGKLMLMKHQRYAHAKQFNRAKRCLKKLKTYLGRVIRDIARKTQDNPPPRKNFARLIELSRRVLTQQPKQRGPKVYSLHAPEVECIGKGKPHKPYEFGVKVSVATPIKHSKGGQFVSHIVSLPGNPYDGHTLAKVIPAMEAMTGNVIERLIADAGYRGHNAPEDRKLRVFTAKQKRAMTPAIKREMKRRSAVEPVIGHLKEEHRMDRNYLAHSEGDAMNAVLAAAGYNFRRLIAWLRFLLLKFLAALLAPLQPIAA
jgi:IS5 family transposase